ncbi:DUF397 domain-containing protein [Streptosporangium sp. NPDC020145]|uniref:DUF397 domain-containing protein n=1 Tax=Streptosporangium sp. NPDC020145 TaxID=3154694 RepID=UPI00343536E8
MTGAEPRAHDNRVEVATDLPCLVAVRDGKNPALTFSASEWKAWNPVKVDGPAVDPSACRAGQRARGHLGDTARARPYRGLPIRPLP